MKEKAGFLMFTLGVMCADSEWLIVPLLLVGTGMWLMRGLVER